MRQLDMRQLDALKQYVQSHGRKLQPTQVAQFCLALGQAWGASPQSPLESSMMSDLMPLVYNLVDLNMANFRPRWVSFGGGHRMDKRSSRQRRPP